MARKSKVSEETTILRVKPSDYALIDRDEDYSKPKKKQRRKKKTGKKALIISGSVFLASVIGFFSWYFILRDSSLPFYACNLGDPVSGESVEVTIESFEPLDAIKNYTLDPEYEYFLIKYTFENKTAESLEWNSFYPYIGINEMKTEPKKNAWFDKLKTIIVQSDSAEEYFDFEALRYYSINNGIDFSSVKNNLEPGEKREDCDVVRIPKGQFFEKSYFITVQELKTAIPLNSPAFELAKPYIREGVILNEDKLLAEPEETDSTTTKK